MSFRLYFERAEQHFLDAAGAGGLELLSDSGHQGCVADFDGHVWLLGFKGTGKSGLFTSCELIENFKCSLSHIFWIFSYVLKNEDDFFSPILKHSKSIGVLLKPND